MDAYVEIFRALADATRLRIMKVLLATSRQVCVCEIVDALELPQYQVSKHLNILRKSGLIHGERKGTWVYHSVVKGDSAFNDQLLELVREQVSDKQLLEDVRKLKRRLGLRDGDTCVVGCTDTSQLECTGSSVDRK